MGCVWFLFCRQMIQMLLFNKLKSLVDSRWPKFFM